MQLVNKSDNVGILISSLCFVHCLATPFIFIAQTCSKTCCAEAPVWWQAIDYIFLAVSFLAIWFSVKNSKKQWIKAALWINLIFLAAVLFFEEKATELFFEHIIFVPALTLIALHFYNKMFCCRKSNYNEESIKNCKC